MKSEIIFMHRSEWMNRDANTEGRLVIISADFDDPSSWPFTLKAYDTFDDDNYHEIKEQTELKKISKEGFEKIKKCIENNSELQHCAEELRGVRVMDGESDHFHFKCDTYEKDVYGSSIISIGENQAEDVTLKKTDYYNVYNAVMQIKDVLQEIGIDVGLWDL